MLTPDNMTHPTLLANHAGGNGRVFVFRTLPTPVGDAGPVARRARDGTDCRFAIE